MSQQNSPYFRSAGDAAPFDPERMGKCDLVSTEGLFCGVNAFEPGQRHEPHVHEDSDKLYAVLRGRGTFVVGESRRILGPGDVALAPAGVEHGVFADGGERLVVLVVMSKTAPPPPAAVEAAVVEPAAFEPADFEPEVVREATPAPPTEEPEAVEEAPESRPAVALPGLEVPEVAEPAEAPPVIPETRPAAPAVAPPGPEEPGVVRASPDLSKILDNLRLAKGATPTEAPPVIPDSKPRAPRTSRVRPATSAPPPAAEPPVIPPSAPATPVAPTSEPEPAATKPAAPAPAAEAPPEIPPSTRGVPVRPPMTAPEMPGAGAPTRGADLLPAAFRKPARRETTPPPQPVPPTAPPAPAPERPPEIPAATRGVPARPPMTAPEPPASGGPPRGADLLPEAFRKPAKRETTPAPQPPPPTAPATPEGPPEIPPATRGVPVRPLMAAPEKPGPGAPPRGADLLPDAFRKPARRETAPSPLAPPVIPEREAVMNPSPPPGILAPPPTNLAGTPLTPSHTDVPGVTLECLVLRTDADRVLLKPEDLAEPILVVPTPVEASQIQPGPIRVVLETDARAFRRTMGTARAVKTANGEPFRYTGLVVRLDRSKGIVVVDVGYPVVARDLGGRAFESLTPGSGVTFDAEGPTRAHVLG